MTMGAPVDASRSTGRHDLVVRQHHLEMPTALRIGGNPSSARLIAKPAKCTETGQLLSGAVFDCRAVYFAVS